MIFLIDLDGTLVDSEHLHHQAWANVLETRPEYIKKIVATVGINDMLEDFSNPHYLRNRKTREMLKFEKIELMKNADKFIDFIVRNNINHVVVTNTNRKVVEHFKAKVPV